MALDPTMAPFCSWPAPLVVTVRRDEHNDGACSCSINNRTLHRRHYFLCVCVFYLIPTPPPHPLLLIVVVNLSYHFFGFVCNTRKPRPVVSLLLLLLIFFKFFFHSSNGRHSWATKCPTEILRLLRRKEEAPLSVFPVISIIFNSVEVVIYRNKPKKKRPQLRRSVPA